MAKKKDPKNVASPAGQDSPGYIVLDTNTFMRLLIIEFATKAKFFEGANERGAQIVLAPFQEDEIWRNLPSVFDDHKAAWKKRLSEARGADTINTALKGLEALGVDVSAASDAAKKLQVATEALKLDDHGWAAFESHAEQVVAALTDLPSEDGVEDVAAALVEKAEARARLRNPPFSPKKDHHLVDCVIWETVIHLLRQGRAVWFATADGDFLYGRGLHPFLAREARAAGGKCRFFPESSDRGFHPGNRFAVAEALLSSKAEAAKVLSAAGLVSPDDLDDLDDHDRDGTRPGRCYCGNEVPIESMHCMKCGQDDHTLSGEENYDAREFRNGYRVFAVHEDHRGNVDRSQIKCQHCGGATFGIYFDSLCSYHQYRASKDD